MSLLLPELHSRGRINLLEPGRLHDALAFSRASTKNVLGPAGSLVTVPSGSPAFGYNANGTYGGLLMEASATNLLLNTDAPATQSYTTTAIVYTLSFYGTGSVVLSGAYAATVTGTGATVRTQLTFTSTAASLTLTLSGSVTKIQLETGNNATSYITSTGTQGTRSADACNTTNLTAIRFNALAGTFVLRGTMPKVNQSNINAMVAFGDGTSQNRIYIIIAPGGVTWSVVSANVLIFAQGLGTPAPGTPIAVAVAWAASNFAGSLNGASPSVFASGALPTVSRLDIGNVGYTTSDPANQYIKSINYYPIRRPNADLQALSV